MKIKYIVATNNIKNNSNTCRYFDSPYGKIAIVSCHTSEYVNTYVLNINFFNTRAEARKNVLKNINEFVIKVSVNDNNELMNYIKKNP